jgi:L-rhamnose mutarotase
MKKIAYTIDLQDYPKLIEEYIEYHRNVWPEVQDGLKSVGLIEMNIYRLGLRMFMVMEVADDFDVATGLPAYLKTHPKCQQWEDMMDKYQSPLPDAKSGEKWSEMNNICHIH